MDRDAGQLLGRAQKVRDRCAFWDEVWQGGNSTQASTSEGSWLGKSRSTLGLAHIQKSINGIYEWTATIL
jgi:hypothetical protein